MRLRKTGMTNVIPDLIRDPGLKSPPLSPLLNKEGKIMDPETSSG